VATVGFEKTSTFDYRGLSDDDLLALTDLALTLKMTTVVVRNASKISKFAVSMRICFSSDIIISNPAEPTVV
jgi:hypothetical protein